MRRFMFAVFIVIYALFPPLIAIAQERIGYPVIDAVRGLPHPELVTVYPDSENSNLFYFLPTSVAIAKQGGVLRFGVQHWGITGPDPEGAGAGLNFSVRPAFDQEAIKKVKDDILLRNPNARFAFPTLLSSTMRILLLGAYHDSKQDKSSPDDVVGGPIDGTAAFAISLTKIGARAFGQDISKDSDVVGAEYKYRFTGIAKRLHAKITVWQKRTYRHFAARAKANAWWGLVKTDWQADYKKLEEDGAITIEILKGGTTDKSEYLVKLFETLANMKVKGEGMFKPELRPAGLKANPESMKSGWGFSSSVAWEGLDENKKFVFEINTAKLEEREFRVALSFSAVCARHPSHFVDLTTPNKRCINPSDIKETAKAVRRCLERKLRWLKRLKDDGLIPESVYLRKVEKAIDDPCYDGEDLAPANFSIVEGELRDLLRQKEEGQLTTRRWRHLVTQLSKMPYFDRRIAPDAASNLVKRKRFGP